MIQYKVMRKRVSPQLGDIRLSGAIAEQMECFFNARVRSEYAKNVIYAETEEQFRLRNDDRIAVGSWRGEYWGKWVISACRVAQYEHDDKLIDFIHAGALRLIDTADPDGYIGTYRNPENYFPCDSESSMKAIGRQCDWNWNIWCRKYTLWGLLEAYQLTNDMRILKAAQKATDQLIDMLHRNGVTLRETGTFCGMPSCSIMKPMLILYRITEKDKYLDFAMDIANDWERPDGARPNLIANAMTDIPLHEWYPHSEKWAKAYEMLSCLDGLLELYRITGVEKYRVTVERIYDRLLRDEQNILFGISMNDVFANSAPYPNALTEPCDLIHWIRICYELHALTGDIKYIDTLERTFYNGFLASAFKDGTWGARAVRSCGRHLVAVGQADMRYSHCCVNNMPRGFLNSAEAFVMEDKNGLYVNLYSDCTAKTSLGTVTISGDYLGTGAVVVKVDHVPDTTIYLRIPAWSHRTVVNGERIEQSGIYASYPVKNGCAIFEMQFDMSTEIHEFPIEPEKLESDNFRVQRFISGNDVPEEIMTWDRRCTLVRGPLLLTRSKLCGNTEDEMFNSPSIFGKGFSAEAEPITDPIAYPNVRNVFRIRFKNTDIEQTVIACDYATGTNLFSEHDSKMFNVYF